MTEIILCFIVALLQKNVTVRALSSYKITKKRIGGIVQMDAGMLLVTGGIILVIALLIGMGAWTVFRNYKEQSRLLNRAHEMTGTANAVISELVEVRRRNRSFRWKNEYPVLSYQVNGKNYTVHLKFAEARKGKYSLGGEYTVRYVPGEPECCIVDEFRSKMQKSRTGNLIGLVVLVILLINILSSIVTLFL